LRVLVCDCLFPEPPVLALRDLHAPRARAIVFAPYAAREAEPGWTGSLDLVDCETGERRRQSFAGGVLDEYREVYARHFALWAEASSRLGVGFGRLPAHASLAEVLGRLAAAGLVEPAPA
jgi:hypothetical protein